MFKYPVYMLKQYTSNESPLQSRRSDKVVGLSHVIWVND